MTTTSHQEFHAPHAQRLGAELIARGLITRAELDSALAEQRREGGLLGLHLIIAGAINRIELYQTLAQMWDRPFVDLRRHPATAHALAEHAEARDFTHAGWVPWREQDGTLVVATAAPYHDDLLPEIRRMLDWSGPIDFVVTTDWDIMRTVQDIGRARLLYRITDHMADTNPDASARMSVVRWQKLVPLTIVLLLAVLGAVRPGWLVITIFTVANLLFTFNIAFKVLYGLRTPLRLRQKRRWLQLVGSERAARGLDPDWPGRIPDDELPTYTILVPVYDEAAVVQKVIGNMDRLDYPKSKLDVLILLEESDTHTIEAAKASHPPEYVRIVVVPEGTPQTKPRACNYGLELARGEYVVIFDAEDRPDPDQLRRAVAAFRMNKVLRERVDPHLPRLVCVQGALTYFNNDYNLLTRMFAIEYAHWFDMMLPGMDDAGLPLPLGGTSNHFETEPLRRLGAWDPYNVTEDADLGLRIASQGYSVGTIESATGEEATSETFAWIRQRTRWIKGYMITAAVNTRHPVRWWQHNGVGGLITMWGLVLGTPLAFLCYPLALLFTLITYIGVQAEWLALPDWLLQTGLLMMIGGNVSMIVLSGIAATKRYSWRIGVYAVFDPIYWLLHSAAAWRAAYQLIFDPFTWEKTPHGLTGDYESDPT